MPITVRGKQYVSPDEAAALRGVKANAIYQLVTRGRLVSYIYDTDSNGVGMMRERQDTDTRRLAWILLDAVEGFTPEKSGPKPRKLGGKSR